MTLATDILFCHSMYLERKVVDFLALDDYLHAFKGIVLAQVLDVFILQSDTSLTGPTGNTLAIVRRTMNADAFMSGSRQAQEPVTIGLDAAATVAEIVTPRRGIHYLRDAEWIGHGAMRSAHIALTGLVALLQTKGTIVAGHHHSVGALSLVDIEIVVFLRHHDEAVFLVLHLLRMGYRSVGIGTDGSVAKIKHNMLFHLFPGERQSFGHS